MVVELYDEDENLEDWVQLNDISLHVRSENNNSEDYYFSANTLMMELLLLIVCHISSFIRKSL